MNIISSNTAPQFDWGEGCKGWWLKQDGPFTVIEETMPPGTAEKCHFHQRTEQFFYCLSSVLTITLDEKTHILQAGHGFVIAPGCAHKVKNTSDDIVRFLVISCPNSHEDRTDLE